MLLMIFFFSFARLAALTQVLVRSKLIEHIDGGQAIRGVLLMTR